MIVAKQLGLEWKIRHGGSCKTERRYIDFLVDGVSLHSDPSMGDTIGCLGWLPPAIELAYIDSLLLEHPNRYGEHYLLYICPECGGFDCGALATTITKTEDHFIWSHFRFLNDYDPSMTLDFEEIAPIYFETAQYQEVLHQRKYEVQQQLDNG